MTCLALQIYPAITRTLPRPSARLLGIIGGILIPILGAVPDGMMILNSGLGPLEAVQEELRVGVGTLAGSTIMLLTVPWALGVWLNRRQLGGPEKRALSMEKTKIKKVLNKMTGQVEPKAVTVLVPVVPKKFSWTKVGATSLATTAKGAKAMMLTAFCYLIIEAPAIGHEADPSGAKREKWFAFAGLWVTLISFFAYLVWQYFDADAVELISEKQRRLCEQWMVIDGFRNLKRMLKGADPFADAETLFSLFDKNGDGFIDYEEMAAGWTSIGYSFDDDQARISFNLLDNNKDGTISRHEFYNWIEDYLLPQFIASQPVPAGAAAGEAKDGSGADLPATLTAPVKAQIDAFLAAPGQTELALSLPKTDRYALHVWAAQAPVELGTHSEDLPADGHHHPEGVRVLRLTKGASSATASIKPTLRPLQPGMPIWCSVSPRLAAFYNNYSEGPAAPLTRYDAAFEALFKTVDHSKSGLASLDQVIRFSQQFALNLTSSQVKFQFYSHDQDLDHKISMSELRAILESLVDTSSLANSPSNTPQQKPLTGPASNSNTSSASGAAAAAAAGASSINGELRVRANGARGNGVTGSPGVGNSVGGDGYQAVVALDISDKDGEASDGVEGEVEEESDEDDEEEEGHSLAGWTRSAKLRWAAFYIAVGTGVVTIFSDPMCEVISALGNKAGINPFYISFIVTPLASNASEVLSSLRFASRKTDVTMGLTFSSLYGAATMNNTFCLSIFLGLVYFRGLAWTFTAEVAAILLVTFIVGIIGLRQTVQLWHAALVGSLFPLSIVFIWGLKHVVRS